MMPRGRVYRYPPGRGMPDVSMPGMGGGMLSVPYDMGGGMQLREAGISQPIPIGALATALANATPAEQRTVGTRVYLFSFRRREQKNSKLYSVHFYLHCLMFPIMFVVFLLEIANGAQ